MAILQEATTESIEQHSPQTLSSKIKKPMVCWSLALKHRRTGFDEVDWSPRPKIYDNAGKGPLGQCAVCEWYWIVGLAAGWYFNLIQSPAGIWYGLEFHIVFESRLKAIATCFRRLGHFTISSQQRCNNWICQKARKKWRALSVLGLKNKISIFANQFGHKYK